MKKLKISDDGAERRSMVMTEDEKKLTAYHEGGHALVSINMPSYDPIHKATIIPRGRALGMVMNLPERDKHGYSIKYLKARMAVCFGGRVAEEIIFGKDDISTGAGGGSGSDINQATQLARAMVTKYGMSEEMGPCRIWRKPRRGIFRKISYPNTISFRRNFSKDR